jgi:hypothetical protein
LKSQFGLPTQGGVATRIEFNETGARDLAWNAANISSEIYFYRLVANAIPSGQAGSFTGTKKLIVLK